MTKSNVFNPRNIEILESEDRKDWQNPQQILDLINLKSYYAVIDLGCGSGYFSIPISKRVSKVYGIDFQKEMLNYFKQKIEKKKIQNIELMRSKANTIPLIKNCTNLLLTVNTLHEFEDRNEVIQEIYRLIKENGRVVIIDFKKEKTNFGPPMAIRISKDDATNLFTNKGFKVTNSYDLKYHYLIIFQKI
ncbi:MAG: class I SAM-dependent methyltransferase [Candidatus Bathyarchaeota archaeon]